ncbi:Hypothetical predicted protein, partial [Paramuricea clavata]
MGTCLFFADNPDTMWEIWKQLFLQVLDKHAPIQNKKKQNPWITSHIKKLIIARDNLKRKAIITKLETDWDNYKKARNETNNLLQQTKKEYYSNKIATEKQDPKAAWKTINTLL